MRQIYCADWVVPICTNPVPEGAVVVAQAQIVAVGTSRELLAQYPEAVVNRFDGAAILPGLVNCHSHLELTCMRGWLEPEESDFFRWLRKLTLGRLEKLTADDLYHSAVWGAVEAVRAGITFLGDAATSGLTSLKALHDVGLRGVVYQEVFGPDPRVANDQFLKLKENVAGLRALETALVRAGVSPHAIYTVSAPLLEEVAGLAVSQRLPLMMHAAESEAEHLLVTGGAGPFATGLASRGIEWQRPGVSTICYLDRLGILRARPLLAHCITVTGNDLDLVAESGATIAHCPKSNAKLSHGSAPLTQFLERKIAVGLGSDSVASNNTCDMLEEARFATLLARLNPGSGITASTALALATNGGARALQLGNHFGMLMQGLEADMTIVKISGTHQEPVYDPNAALVFSSSGHDVILTMVAGRVIYRDGHVMTVDEDRLRARMYEIKSRLSS